ncbi:uncharacterized protein NMK_2383 [Novimethylophilus kurashikiensis]|uniref:Uncharacterized protein n=1 Tax=Novimethylophilus kurashikiensis TaxID=1825523 RepID=A0A2R5F959_9PROT|nr:uncharacterized protein NMK_2383 [Novimethylophilus kurashikiensis]
MLKILITRMVGTSAILSLTNYAVLQFVEEKNHGMA